MYVMIDHKPDNFCNIEYYVNGKLAIMMYMRLLKNLAEEEVNSVKLDEYGILHGP